MRQHEKRIESISLQKYLQSAVQSQSVVIQDLQNILKRRLQCEPKLSIPDVILWNRSTMNMKDAMFYKTYFDSLSILYGKLDEVFKEVGFNLTQERIFAGVPMRKKDGETEYYEKKWVGTVPFTYGRTCDAVWALAAAPHRQDQRCQYDDLQDAEDSIGVKYYVTVQNNRETIIIRNYQVAKRYVEESRMVVVWRALSDASEDFPGITQDETGWCIVHIPSRNATDQGNTLVQACIRLTPMHFRSNDASMTRMVAEFMELSMKLGMDDSLEIQRMIASLLLEEALYSDELDFDDSGILDF
ncbi:hypothetical protein PHMEG_00018346 [Phytophthora megakarya]|uniref:M96 mating-specific protein n=1 Tax=Phytophthora megakarya TaxID=4795 RepID=A0A225VU89_9STRA|nr:hypothetical protein PHMEG_00018346 [Phytophthora megakarya]